MIGAVIGASAQTDRHRVMLMNDIPPAFDPLQADRQAAVCRAAADCQQTVSESDLGVGDNLQLAGPKAVRTRRVVREEELPRIPVGVEALLLNRLGHVEHDDVLSSVGRHAVYVSLADSVTPVVDEVANSGFVAVTGHLISPVVMETRGVSRRRAAAQAKDQSWWAE